MTTLKFKGTSPYATPLPPPPTEDYINKIYQDRVDLKSDRVGAKVLNVAVFGVDRDGTLHMDLLARNPDINILYVVEDSESKWNGLRAVWSLENTTFLTSKQASVVYEDTKVDVVIVTTPSHTRESIVMQSLKAKKHVFCEKPIALTREASEKCYEAAQAADRILFCGFNKRFDPAFKTVRDRVNKGEIGHVQIIKLVSRDPPLPALDDLKSSGGIFQDSLVHDIDNMNWTLGEFPVKVVERYSPTFDCFVALSRIKEAHTSLIHQISVNLEEPMASINVSAQAHAFIPEIKAMNDYDTIAATFYYPSGTLGVIDVSRNAVYGLDQRMEVFGPKGMITAVNEQPIHGVQTQYGVTGLTTAPLWHTRFSRFQLAYRLELEHFLDAVRGNVQPIVQGKEILAVSKIAAACEESARTGNMVELKWAPGELPEKWVA